MSFGGQAPPDSLRSVKCSQPLPDSLAVAGRRRGGRQEKEGKGNLRSAYPRASRPFTHLAPNLRKELSRTQRALVSVSLLIDSTRPADIPLPVAYRVMITSKAY